MWRQQTKSRLINDDTLYWGLKFYEWATLVGIVVGPVVAVSLTLIIEAKRRSRDSKIQIMRMILNTRHMPADAAYSTAINLIPVEFNGDKKVMDAWQEYISQVRLSLWMRTEAGTKLSLLQSRPH